MSGMLYLLIDRAEVVAVLDGYELTIDFHGQVFELIALHTHGLFKHHIVLILAEDTLNLLGVVINTLETILGLKFSVLGKFLLETGVILLFIKKTGEFA